MADSVGAEPLLFVSADQIVPLIKQWEEQGNTLVQLEREVKINQKTIGRLKNGEAKSTNELIADRLILALDMPWHRFKYQTVNGKPVSS